MIQIIQSIQINSLEQFCRVVMVIRYYSFSLWNVLYFDFIWSEIFNWVYDNCRNYIFCILQFTNDYFLKTITLGLSVIEWKLIKIWFVCPDNAYFINFEIFIHVFLFNTFKIIYLLMVLNNLASSFWMPLRAKVYNMPQGTIRPTGFQQSKIGKPRQHLVCASVCFEHGCGR